MSRWTPRGLVTALLALAALIRLETAAQGVTTTRVSVASDGTQGNANSSSSSISADGRFVAFVSYSTNLVAGDTNGQGDVFAHDRQTGQTTRVSVASDGTEGNGFCSEPSISADGRFVAFYSSATNLVAGDTNGVGDVFVHDRQTSQTTRVSVASDGTEGNGGSGAASISADGRFVAFLSDADNLVPGDTNGSPDVFVHDRQTGQTTRVSVASNGTQGNGTSGEDGCSISADGRFVAFISGATNLVAGDTNGEPDVFVHDRQTGQTTRASVASDGTQSNGGSELPSITGDGRFVAFISRATNLVAGDTNGAPDVFVHDRQTGQTTRVSVASDGTEGNNTSLDPLISADARFVAFDSGASTLVAGDTNGEWDAFLHDRQTGQTTRVSVASDGTEGNQGSGVPSISADGRFVAFYSRADNLVAGDTNGFADVFVHDRGLMPPVVTSFAINNGAASTTSQVVALKNICAGSPTDYMASESPDLSGASWLPYSTAPSFTLSSGSGTKTVYLKVKNGVGESGAVWDSIEYNPAVPTVSPVVPTQCPKVTTQCPTLATSCPPTTTKCPPTATKCPAVTTKCPPVTTKCPSVTTKCPPITTLCPPITTKCPPVTTACPTTTTKCPPVTTLCPPVTTKCPPVTTACPPTTTKCPPVTTLCPPVTTKCPPTTTLCPATTTKCPPVTTACPPTTTKCPAANTQCPAVGTSCPACP